MFTISRHWFIILIASVILLGRLARTDSSQAASLIPERGLQVLDLQTSEKIEQDLLTTLEEKGQADFIVRFTEQADLSPAFSMDWEARGEFVYNTLRDVADRSQANAKKTLDAAGVTYQTFIAGNDLYIHGGSISLASGLAALPEVYYIRATRTYYIDPIEAVKPFDPVTWAGDYLAYRALTTVGSSPEALDWGISDTMADQFWTAYSAQGEGILVANIDTGVQWNHPALDQSFKCGTVPTDPACWYDPANICKGAGACDNNGHGTHTMGSMVGDDDPTLAYLVGMAPHAQWIACKGCERRTCSDASLSACADWILAPGGDPANRPNVVNNSWGGGSGDTWYQVKVQAWVAAGIFPAFSAGNEGPFCDTLGSPGDYQESFGSAAHDSGRLIADFSSRGPSFFGHDPYTKPNISSPGSSIISTYPTNAWAYMSGTSMASPHSAGAVALLWSCNPTLIGQLDMTFELLQNNADTPAAGNCSAPPDGQGNYTYGYGYLNMLAVGQAGCYPTAVTLLDFNAASQPHGILLSWRSAQETDLLGFYLYRAETVDGLKTRINEDLIAAINPGQLLGNPYQYLDDSAAAGKIYYYWVEWIGMSGNEIFGPVSDSFAAYAVWIPIGMR